MTQVSPLWDAVMNHVLRVIYTVAGKAYIAVTAYFTRSTRYDGFQI